MKAVSVTLAVQVVAWLIRIETEVHETTVIVGSGGGATAILVPPVLDKWIASPPYATMTL
jgi:hypothetical protein